jgi:uncharacterized protein YbaA (DUF1428 family)
MPSQNSNVTYHAEEIRMAHYVDGFVVPVPRLKDMMDPQTMPFDGMRMCWGGFKRLVEFP